MKNCIKLYCCYCSVEHILKESCSLKTGEIYFLFWVWLGDDVTRGENGMADSSYSTITGYSKRRLELSCFFSPFGTNSLTLDEELHRV